MIYYQMLAPDFDFILSTVWLINPLAITGTIFSAQFFLFGDLLTISIVKGLNIKDCRN